MKYASGVTYNSAGLVEGLTINDNGDCRGQASFAVTDVDLVICGTCSERIRAGLLVNPVARLIPGRLTREMAICLAGGGLEATRVGPHQSRDAASFAISRTTRCHIRRDVTVCEEIPG